MDDPATADLVALALSGVDLPEDEEAPAPLAASLAGIADVLGTGERTMADRFALLSAISKLEEEGHVEERVAPVRGLDGERTVYALTEAGRERAAAVRDRVAGREIRVDHGDERERLPLEEVDRYVGEPALARTLARLTDDDVLYLHEEVGDGLVDREAELHTLEASLSAVEDGRSRAALVAGEAGVGKTTLVSRLLERARQRGFRVLEGVCRRDAEAAYAPFRAALSGHVATSPFAEQRPTPEDAEAFEAQRSVLFADVADSLESLAATAPVVVFVDDLHSADEATVELFEGLADRIEAPVLLVGAYRPGDVVEDHPLAGTVEDWTGPRRERVVLEAFDAEETETLVERVVGTRRVPGSFARAVHERTGGNPLFVTEATERMLETGVVVPGSDRYPTDPGAVPVPDRVEETIQIRLSALPDDAHDVLEVAALVGETVPLAVLSAAVAVPAPRVREIVDLLVDGRILERIEGEDAAIPGATPSTTGDAERTDAPGTGRSLRFVSGLVRETVVDGVAPGRERTLHRQIAGAYREVADDPEDHAAAVAEHYRRADDADRALEYYRTAARRAEAVYASGVAVENYERALEVARELDDERAVLSVLESLGETYRLAGDYEAADRHLQFVAERTDDPATRQRIARLRSRVASRQGEYERAIEYANRGLAIGGDGEGGDPDGAAGADPGTGDETEAPAGDPETDAERAGDTGERARLLCHRGWSKMQRGEFDAGREDFETARELADRLGDPELLGLALHDIATVELTQANAGDEVVETFEAAAAARERAGDRLGLGDTYNNLGAAYIRRHELDAAQRALERAREQYEAVGNRPDVLSALNNLGKVHQLQGDHEAALATFSEVLEEGGPIGARQSVANALSNVGEIHYALGDPGEAVDDLQRALSLQEELGNTRWQVSIHRNLADVRLSTGEVGTAERHARRALQLAEERGMSEEYGLALRRLGDVALERGDVLEAVDYHERALDALSEFDVPSQDVAVRASLAESYLAAGRPEDAREQARLAREQAVDVTEDDPENAGGPTFARATLVLGKCHREAGEDARARELLASALSVARGADTPEGEAEAHLELGRLYRDRGDPEKAADQFRAGRERAADVGSDLVAGKCEAELDALGEG